MRTPRSVASIRSERSRPTPRDQPAFSAYQWVVLVLLIITVSRIHSHYAILRALRPAALLGAAGLLLAFLNPGGLALRRFFRTRPAKIMAGVAALAAVSAPFGISLGASATFIIETYSRTLLFAILLAGAIKAASDLSRYLWAYVTASAILVWMALFVFSLTTYGSAAARLNNLYTYDANDLGVVLLSGLPLAALLAQASTGVKRVAAILVAMGIGAAVARTGSRGAFIGMIVVGLALLTIVRGISVRKRLGFVAVAVVALAVASPPGYWEQMRTMVEPTTDYNWTSVNGRKAITMRGLGYIARYPVFGLGIDNFARAEGTISERARNSATGGGVRWIAPHNTYLQIGAEMGVPALILWVALFPGGILVLLRLRRRIPPDWERGPYEQRLLYHAPAYLAVMLLAFSTTSAFVSFAYLDTPYILAIFVGGYIVALKRALRRHAYGTPRGGSRLEWAAHRRQRPRGVASGR